MNKHRLAALAAALAFLPLFSGSGPGEAAGRARLAIPARADFRVVVWYRKTDPLGTFQYQIYDIRRGEDSPAVDSWVKNLVQNFPTYYVVSRPVDLARERGETDRLKVGSVVKRELMVAAAQAGVVIGGSTSPPFSAQTSRSPETRAARPIVPFQPAPTNLGPAPPSFPNPFPYPRPHP